MVSLVVEAPPISVAVDAGAAVPVPGSETEDWLMGAEPKPVDPVEFVDIPDPVPPLEEEVPLEGGELLDPVPVAVSSVKLPSGAVASVLSGIVA
jgi:hypothetical protein